MTALINKDNESYMRVQKILQKLRKDNVDFSAIQNIEKYITLEDLKMMENSLKELYDIILDFLLLDTKKDYNLIETSKRISKMYIREILKGRYTPMPSLATFPNKDINSKELHIVGPIKSKKLMQPSLPTHHWILHNWCCIQ
jgi:GTP cyclohydrolase IA